MKKLFPFIDVNAPYSCAQFQCLCSIWNASELVILYMHHTLFLGETESPWGLVLGSGPLTLRSTEIGEIF